MEKSRFLAFAAGIILHSNRYYSNFIEYVGSTKGSHSSINSQTFGCSITLRLTDK